jgi:hypothetical protein
MKTTSVRFALALAVVLSATAGARAELIHGTGVVSSFDGSFSYSASNSTAATLVISITNTTALPIGYLSGIAFNNPGNQITGVTFSSTDPNFALLGAPGFQDGVPVASLVPLQFGLFDVGAGTGSTIYGTPFKGLKPGQSATFTLGLSGTGLNGLNASSFFATDSAPIGNLPPLHGGFVANFNDFGVVPDVAQGKILVEDVGHPDAAPTPEPATGVLGALGAGLLGASAWRRYRLRR